MAAASRYSAMLVSRILGGEFGPDHLHHLLVADVLVVMAGLRLARRREDRLGQLARVAQARRQLHAADRLRLLIFRPAAARQVAAHHRFDRDRLQAAHQHRAARDLRHFGGSDDALGRLSRQMVGTQVTELAEPEQGHLREQFALARDRLAHDHVEGRQAVAGDHEETVGADRVVVAHLAAREQRQRDQGGGVQGGGHGRGSKRKRARRSNGPFDYRHWFSGRPGTARPWHSGRR